MEAGALLRLARWQCLYLILNLIQKLGTNEVSLCDPPLDYERRKKIFDLLKRADTALEVYQD